MVWGDLPDSVRARLTEYFGHHEGTCAADVVVALLRLNELGAAELMLGRPVTRCPPGIPPWPPKPARREAAQPRVASVAANPCRPSTPAHQRYRLVRVGMTQDQLKSRGLSRRDVRLWTEAGHITWRDQ